MCFVNKKNSLGVMAEWSKAVDLSSTIFGCAGSNPADTNIKFLYSNTSFFKEKVTGSIPVWGFPISSIGRAAYANQWKLKQKTKR